MTRINAHIRAPAQLKRNIAEQRGETVNMRGVNRKLHPTSRIGEEGVGILEWKANMRRWLMAAGAINLPRRGSDVNKLLRTTHTA